MYKILMLVQDSSACAYYRAVLPTLHCAKDLRSEGIQLDISENLNLDDNHDCYIFHRLINPEFFPVLWDLKFNKKKKIVWDIDDNLFVIPEWSPANELSTPGRKRCLIQCLDWADHITLTTQRFYQQFATNSAWSDKLTVLPNLIDRNDWNIENLPVALDHSRAMRFLWAGSLTHQKDIDIIGNVVQEIIDEYETRVQFIFMGGMPEVLQLNTLNANKNRKNVISFGTCHLLHYPMALRILQPDVALIPVLDCDFNNAKSNIKYLEMTFAGAACIASDVGPYKDTVSNGKDGFLCHDEFNWKEKIELLLDYPSVAREYRDRAYQKVIDYYSWQSLSRETWLNFFRSLP